MAFNMFYEQFTSERFFTEITTEDAARELIWRSRFNGKEFICPHIANQKTFTFYAAVLKSVLASPAVAKLDYEQELCLKPLKRHCWSGLRHSFMSCKVNAAYLLRSYNVIWVKVLRQGMGYLTKNTHCSTAT